MWGGESVAKMKRRELAVVKILAAAALLGIGGALLWAGPRAGRTQPLGEVVFLGDSITEYCDLAVYYPDLEAVNEGIAGDTTGGMLGRLEQVYAAGPSFVVVHGGINDLLSGYSADQIVDNLRAIVQNIRERLPDARIVLQSLYPIAEGEDLYFTGQIRAINARLEQLAGETSCRYADVFSALQTADGRLDSRYSDDGLHPNAAGYEAACPVVREALDKAAGD